MSEWGEMRECTRCGQQWDMKQMQSHHIIPVVMFWGDDRKEQKQHADKYSAQVYLCGPCHKLCLDEFINNGMIWVPRTSSFLQPVGWRFKPKEERTCQT